MKYKLWMHKRLISSTIDLFGRHMCMCNFADLALLSLTAAVVMNITLSNYTGLSSLTAVVYLANVKSRLGLFLLGWSQ